MSSFEKLNSDCIYSIFSFLSYGELGKVACVSKRCKELSEKEEIWKALFLKTVGSLPKDIAVTKIYCRDSYLFRGGIEVQVMGILNPNDEPHKKHLVSFALSDQWASDSTLEDLLIQTIKKLFASKNIEISADEIKKKYLSSFSALTEKGQDFYRAFPSQSLSDITFQKYREHYRKIIFWIIPNYDFGNEFPNISPNSPNVLSKVVSAFKKFLNH